MQIALAPSGAAGGCAVAVGCGLGVDIGTVRVGVYVVVAVGLGAGVEVAVGKGLGVDVEAAFAAWVATIVGVGGLAGLGVGACAEQAIRRNARNASRNLISSSPLSWCRVNDHTILSL